LLKILSVFVLILVLLRLKWHLGIVMLVGAVVLAVLTWMGPAEFLRVSFRSATEATALSLYLALALIMVLENILRKTNTLKRLVDCLRGLLGDHRVVMALMPAIIGILPSAGGAYFSAPLVEESATGCVVTGERKSFVNYWFRHIWEYVSPLYPGFILTAAIFHVSYGSLFAVTIAFSVTVVITGAVWGLRDIERPDEPAPPRRVRHDLWGFAVSFLPIVVIMVLVLGLGVNIALALTLVVGALLVYHRYGARRIVSTVRESVSLKTLLLVFSVLVFKGVMEGSGVIGHVPNALESAGVPVTLILFALPFLVGLMTGLTIAYVGICFPLLLPLIGATHPDMGMLAFAFAAGFAGVMFSPVHLCLVLTKDYFKAELSPIYRIMVLPETAVMVVALAQMAVLSPGVFGA
jgi:integral membrane protein (TIGR00529 family)